MVINMIIIIIIVITTTTMIIIITMIIMWLARGGDYQDLSHSGCRSLFDSHLVIIIIVAIITILIIIFVTSQMITVKVKIIRKMKSER